MCSTPEAALTATSRVEKYCVSEIERWESLSQDAVLCLTRHDEQTRGLQSGGAQERGGDPALICWNGKACTDRICLDATKNRKKERIGAS